MESRGAGFLLLLLLLLSILVVTRGRREDDHNQEAGFARRLASTQTPTVSPTLSLSPTPKPTGIPTTSFIPPSYKKSNKVTELAGLFGSDEYNPGDAAYNRSLDNVFTCPFMICAVFMFWPWWRLYKAGGFALMRGRIDGMVSSLG